MSTLARCFPFVLPVIAACTGPRPRATSGVAPDRAEVYRVGVRRFEWVDSSRREIADLMRRDSLGVPRPLPAAGPRRLIAQVWYPTHAAGSLSPYNASALPFVGVLRDTARMRLYAASSSPAIADAPPATGQHFPLVLFSPGSNMFTEDYTLLLADLARHGYVVVAIGHPGTSLVAFRDGTFGVETAWRPPASLSMDLALDSLRKSWAYYQQRDRYLTADIDDAIRRLASPRTSPLGGVIDTTRMAFLGHSTGGAVAATAIRSRDGHGRHALVVYDVLLPTLLFDAPLASPFLLFRTTATNYPPGWTERLLGAFAGTRGEAFDALVLGGTHQGFSDRLVLGLSDTLASSPARAQHLGAAHVTRVFLDRALNGRGASLPDDSTQWHARGISLRAVRAR